MKLGVISDTHNFLDPKIPQLLAGVEHIFHAGDIGLPGLIQELERVAPVTAVGGNTDDPGFHYGATEVVELAGRKFLVHHAVNPHSLSETLETRITREQPDAVVFGHTHRPFCETIRGRLYFNPGSAGKSHFGLERSVAILHCNEEGIRPEYFRLGF